MFCRYINGFFIFFPLCKSFAKPFGKALPQTLLKRVEAYHGVIYLKSRFGLVFEVQIYSVQPIARESQALVCVLSELQWFR